MSWSSLIIFFLTDDMVEIQSTGSTRYGIVRILKKYNMIDVFFLWNIQVELLMEQIEIDLRGFQQYIYFLHTILHQY